MKINSFLLEELERIKNATDANDEDIETVAIEMGRTCSSVHLRIYDLHRLSRYALLKKGKFSVEEVWRMKQIVLQGRYMTRGPITLLYFLELVSWQITNINVKRSPNHHHSQRLRGW